MANHCGGFVSQKQYNAEEILSHVITIFSPELQLCVCCLNNCELNKVNSPRELYNRK